MRAPNPFRSKRGPLVTPTVGKLAREKSTSSIKPGEDVTSTLLSPEATKRIHEIRTEMEEYRASLDKMSGAEIDTLFREELEKQNLEDDQARFFHASSAEADFDYWSKMAHWSLDEAIALSFGKAPEIVSETRLADVFSWKSPFVREYQKTMELARRAVVWKQLYDPVLPTIFVKWAQEHDVPLPDELVARVEARSGAQIDWKQLYETASEQNKAYAEANEQLIANLKIQIDELKSDMNEPKPLHTKERESLLKLVIGMAVGGYGFDPGESRSPTATEITDDLVRHGISLNTDTVRKWLKEAAEHLPREIPDD